MNHLILFIEKGYRSDFTKKLPIILSLAVLICPSKESESISKNEITTLFETKKPLIETTFSKLIESEIIQRLPLPKRFEFFSVRFKYNSIFVPSPTNFPYHRPFTKEIVLQPQSSTLQDGKIKNKKRRKDLK